MTAETPVTIRSLSHAPLGELLREAEARVRAQPALAAHRWALFQILCVVQAWERAVQQLQTYAQLEESQTRVVHAYRHLIRAERARIKVMSGEQQPDFIFDEAPEWMRGLLTALGLSAANQADAADDAREAALDMAPLVAGAGEGHRFSWIADSDTRLGPVCEFIAEGRYRWLAFDDIAQWQVRRPSSLVDLVWAPCNLMLHDGTTLHGFMPARYASTSSSGARDALLLGHETVWRECGRTGVFGEGRKTWTTSAGDVGLFDLAECVLGAGANDDAGADA
jgi:type VI secretion system protein ImpE